MEQLRAGIFIDDDKLFDFASSSAKLLRISGDASGRDITVPLRRSYIKLKHSYTVIEKRYGSLASPPAACEWLLDNWYMIQREYQCACRELRREEHLRAYENGTIVYELCRALISAGQGQFTKERCLIFLDGFQSVTVLRRSELHCLPGALRAAVIFSICQVCSDMLETSELSSCSTALEALFGSLRLISVLDTEKLINAADISNAVLSADPTGVYPKMDAGTRQDYLRRVEKLARQKGVEEHEYARAVIKKAKAEKLHVGFFLFDKNKKRGVGAYIAANVTLTLFSSLLLSFIFDSAAAALLLLFPVSELVKSLLDFLLLRLVPARRLPRMDTQNGIPQSGKSICVISTLLDGSDPASRLEELYYACRRGGKALQFGLLADYPVAQSQDTPADEALLSPARLAVDTLNKKHGGGFFLFTRPRCFDGTAWSGYERKRGAILELAKLLCREKNTLCITGDAAALSDTRFIITLDSDTRVYPDAVLELVGAMLHPLNSPVIDEKRRVVSSGHALIHPRMDTELKSANDTDFAIIFAGAGGCDPYGSLCGELYMNAFESGGFAGKGIIDAKALLFCTGERFPEGCVLSHDALEGAFLKGAYMGDVEFSDSFPAKPLNYFRRLHRWVRGDWQNLPWLFAKGISDIDRWRLFDSMRRSLVTPFTLAALVLGFLLQGGAASVAAWAALLALLSRLLISMAERGLSRRESVRLRRYTRVLSGVGGAIVQTFIRLWLLPYEAWVCVSAVATALWRMLVSRKNLLQWQTFSQNEQSGGASFDHTRAMWFPLLLGLGLMCFSPSVMGKSAGLMWLLSPAVASALALPARSISALPESDRRFLISEAAESWHYLSEFSSTAENYLPPDNFQEQPPVGVAHRSSPTNIGLALASAVAVADMGVIGSGEAEEYIRRAVEALEHMERFMGHFYNWYDTRTLRPLPPAYISTVDSGNLYAGLLVAKQAAEGWGYHKLGSRLNALMVDMDFSPLYDANRGLFYICYEVSGRRGAGGWYDLMASEARLTSYIAVAKGDVPVKHWRRLSRAQLQQDGYRGLASWTGTMFEYLMPELFLPLYHGSLLYESAKFCLYAQRRQVFSGKPWGESESAFFSLDPSLSYRYKAHGCASLALKRGQDADMVVSPYSSFLALAVEPHGAAENLRRFRAFGAIGRWGFIEALDFTPSRCRSSNGEQVRCYMAHHVGMSIIAASNAVCGSIRDRFMSESMMSACSLLLQEKLPADGVIIRRSLSQAQERYERTLSDRWRIRGGRDDREEKCCVLSNGSYSMTVLSSGETTSSLGDILVSTGGLSVALNSSSASLELPAAVLENWELSEEQCSFTVASFSLSLTETLCVSGREGGEFRAFEAFSPINSELTVSFVPLLARKSDWRSHPAFWSLGLFARSEGNSLIIRRVRRGDMPELWMCLKCDKTAHFSADKNGSLGWLSQPFVMAKLDLAGGVTESIKFALCISKTEEEAVNGAERILSDGFSGYGSMAGAAALRLGMKSADIGATMDLLSPLIKNSLREAAPRRDLWQYGISGDLPLICCDGMAAECLSILRSFCLLKSCGIGAELVYLTDEQGEYLRPLFRRVCAELAKFSLEALISNPGGVFFAPTHAAELIKSRSVVVVGEKPKLRPPLPRPLLSLPRAIGSKPFCKNTKDGFIFEVDNNLPSRAWQLMLTNGDFGYIATDCGIGGMFFQNAREMQINKPCENICATSGSELLWLWHGEKPVSLFAANDALACKVSYSLGVASWEKRVGEALVKTTVFIPPNCAARVLIIEGAAGIRLGWSLETVFGSSDDFSVRCRKDGMVFCCDNPESYISDAVFYAASSSPCKLSADFDRAGMYMELTAQNTTVLCCGCCDSETLLRLCDAVAAHNALEATKSHWKRICGKLEISTGIGALDNYVNHWCVYQCLAGRILGRSSLYQSGGAIGFRDQLQDTINLLLIDPKLARERIIDSCRHQYEEGDVMHWWHSHPDGDKGVRSRCSDDLMWLVWALCEYVRATGDLGICDLELPYLSSTPLSDNEKDRYETPEMSTMCATVLQHALNAAELCLNRGTGPHSLPYFGSGDWNDALDYVNGESVWLGFFMSCCLHSFAELLNLVEGDNSERYFEAAKSFGTAANHAWNGRYFLRGYNSDGSPLGGTERIDSLPQSWSALCPYVKRERAETAVRNAFEALIDNKYGLVKLFTPPFSPSEQYSGYIVSYGEGFRENGGQYTHGALWLAQAAAVLGLKVEALKILTLLLPENHSLSVYGGEPFVLPADVSAAVGHEGEAGWTWYTGSAGWYFRIVSEKLLGLHLENGLLSVDAKESMLCSYTLKLCSEDGEVKTVKQQDGEIRLNGDKYEGEAL